MINKHLSIVGFGHNRDDKDYYPTPPETTQALFKKERFEGNVWEPASGNGWMSKVIEKYNKCVSSDIRTDNEVYGERGIDFLKTFRDVDNIITNPPYKYAKEFVLHAKECATKKIAMLLKLVFLEGTSRYSMFQDKDFPLKTVYVFCKRQPIRAKTYTGKNSSMITYAWYVWDKNHVGNPVLEWVK